MHIHAYIRRVCDLELYSDIQGWRECLWTLVDLDMYMRRVAIFPYYSQCFFFLISSQKTLSSPISLTIVWQIFPITTASYMTSPPYILLFSQHSPVICKDFSPLFTCINWVDTTLYSISIWVLCSLSQPLSKALKPALLQPSSFWLILPVTSWSYH